MYSSRNVLDQLQLFGVFLGCACPDCRAIKQFAENKWWVQDDVQWFLRIYLYIWHKVANKDEVKQVVWSLKVIYESNVSRKSITEFTGTSSLLRKGILISGSLTSSCHEPKTMSLVLLGLMSWNSTTQRCDGGRLWCYVYWAIIHRSGGE